MKTVMLACVAWVASAAAVLALILASPGQAAPRRVPAARAGATHAKGPPCVRPNPAALFHWSDNTIEGIPYNVAYRPVGIGRLRWMAGACCGLGRGKVFILACDGSSLAERDVGGVESIKVGPFVDGMPTLEVRDEEAWGTNINERSVVLLQFDGQQLRVLWRHDAMSLGSFPKTLAPTETATLYHWRYFRHATRIRLTEVETDGVVTNWDTGAARGRVRVMSVETYCLSRATRTFKLCGRWADPDTLNYHDD